MQLKRAPRCAVLLGPLKGGSPDIPDNWVRPTGKTAGREDGRMRLSGQELGCTRGPIQLFVKKQLGLKSESWATLKAMSR